MDDKYLTVTALTKYLKYKFDTDPNLRKVFLKGEISNFKSHTTGHFYFSIKDETSKINAIMFSNNTKKLNFIPKEGMKVLVTGLISVYESTGGYQIYVDDLIEDGVGNLYIAFEQLKEKLTKEGLFDQKNKKSIPKYPTKIGIITASTGAAIKDILSTIKRRYPICETYLFPCLVQGENSSKDIVKKINQAENFKLDVLIVGRGGGSFEDLNSFNDEDVARTIFASNIPIISAVGHEVDFTIADFVADLRAPTPTGAAEMAVPNLADLINKLEQYKIRINEATLKTLNYNKLYLDSIKNSFVIKNPMIMYQNKQQNLDLILDKLNNIMLKKVDITKNKFDKLKSNYILKNPNILFKNHIINLNNIIEKLEIINPIGVLKRGFTLTYNKDILVKTITDVKLNDSLKIKLIDGDLNVNVVEIKGETHE
ncbi:MAG: exodeoxyribonuclease VII large subunit [Bacilli bacterium]